MFKNWKTSLAGLLAGAAQVLSNPVHKWTDLIAPVLIAVLGLLSGDASNVSKN